MYRNSLYFAVNLKLFQKNKCIKFIMYCGHMPFSFNNTVYCIIFCFTDMFFQLSFKIFNISMECPYIGIILGLESS